MFSPENTFYSHPGVGPDISVAIIAAADQGVGEPDVGTAAMEYRSALDVAARMIEDSYAGFALNNSTNHGTVSKEASLRYSLVLHPGDLSYARGYGALWDTFLLQQAPVATRIPYATAIGNHERDWPGQELHSQCADSGGECGIAYEKRFPMPNVRHDAPW
jgi:acid phosphatase type 7